MPLSSERDWTIRPWVSALHLLTRGQSIPAAIQPNCRKWQISSVPGAPLGWRIGLLATAAARTSPTRSLGVSDSTDRAAAEDADGLTAGVQIREGGTEVRC